MIEVTRQEVTRQWLMDAADREARGCRERHIASVRFAVAVVFGVACATGLVLVAIQATPMAVVGTILNAGNAAVSLLAHRRCKRDATRFDMRSRQASGRWLALDAGCPVTVTLHRLGGTAETIAMPDRDAS